MVCEVCRTGPAGVTELGALGASEGAKYKSKKVGKDARTGAHLFLIGLQSKCTSHFTPYPILTEVNVWRDSKYLSSSTARFLVVIPMRHVF